MAASLAVRDTKTGFLQLAALPRLLCRVLGSACLIHSRFYWKAGQPGEAGGVAVAGDGFNCRSELTTSPAPTNVWGHLKPPSQFSKMAYYWKRKSHETKSSNLVVTLESRPWEQHSLLEQSFTCAYYPGLCIAPMNGCHDNMVNRIRVTPEGCNGIVLFRAKNGCFNASFTKTSWRGKAAFLWGVCRGCSQKPKMLAMGALVTGEQVTSGAIRKTGRILEGSSMPWRVFQEVCGGNGTISKGCKTSGEESKGLMIEREL